MSLFSFFNPQVWCQTRQDQRNKSLFAAATEGSIPAVEAALKSGAQIDTGDSEHGWTALHMAAIYGHTGTALKLLELGADPEAQDLNRVNSIEYAHTMGHSDTAAALEKQNQLNRYLFDYATIGWYNDVKEVLRQGAQINARDSRYSRATALHRAAICGKHPIILLLLEMGANPAVQDMNGLTSAQYARAYRFDEVVRTLEEKVSQQQYELTP